MNLKTVIISLCVAVLVLTTGLYLATKNKFNLYTDAAHVNYNEVLDDVETPTIYYYYQDTCHFCNSIKDQVTELYLASEKSSEINLKLVDVKSAENKDAWTSDSAYDPANYDLSNVENIEISGTPTMILVEQGEVVDYKVGADVFDIMENANERYDLGLTFDRSKYGQE